MGFHEVPFDEKGNIAKGNRVLPETLPETAPKQLLIVPGADHVDLYDRMDRIPFDKLAEFFTKNLK